MVTKRYAYFFPRTNNQMRVITAVAMNVAAALVRFT